MQTKKILLPFKVDPAPPFAVAEDDSSNTAQLWMEGLKRQAKDNLEGGETYIRIAWQNRFKKPKHDNYDDYTPEEAVLEMWEQFYFENPQSLELQNIFKRKNKLTGYSYYTTGDPVIDKLEEAFGRGETPDLSVIDVKGGKDIFREKVFIHTQRASAVGAQAGEAVAPRKGIQGVQTNAEGEKITASGAKVQHDDFRTDDWVKEMLENDPGLKAIAEKVNASK